MGLEATSCEGQICRLRPGAGQGMARIAVKLLKTQVEVTGRAPRDAHFSVPVEAKGEMRHAEVRISSVFNMGEIISLEIRTRIQGVGAELNYLIVVRGQNGYYCSGRLINSMSAQERLMVGDQVVELKGVEFRELLAKVMVGLRRKINEECARIRQRPVDAFFGKRQ